MSQSHITRRKNAEARFNAAVAEFIDYSAGKEWVSREQIGLEFPLKSDGLYGRIKSHLGIPHRRVKTEQGSRYEWNLGAVKAPKK